MRGRTSRQAGSARNSQRVRSSSTVRRYRRRPTDASYFRASCNLLYPEFVEILMHTSVQAPARPGPPAGVGPGGQASPTTPSPQITVSLGPAGSEVITIPTPRTARDIEALKARREELSTQLKSVDGRRSKLISQLKQTGDPTAIKGLEARL